MAAHHGVRPVFFADLQNALRERFGSPLREKRAWAGLRDVRQRPGENVRAYAHRFEGLLSHLPHFDPTWALNQFQWGLSGRIAELVAGDTQVKTLADAILKAEHLEMAHQFVRRDDTFSGRGGRGGRLPSRGGGRGAPLANTDSVGRSTGQMTRGRGSQGRVPLICYRCGRAGHRRSECRVRLDGGTAGRTQQQRGRGRTPGRGGVVSTVVDAEGDVVMSQNTLPPVVPEPSSGN